MSYSDDELETKEEVEDDADVEIDVEEDFDDGLGDDALEEPLLLEEDDDLSDLEDTEY
jgi:hypothetical protein